MGASVLPKQMRFFTLATLLSGSSGIKVTAPPQGPTNPEITTFLPQHEKPL